MSYTSTTAPATVSEDGSGNVTLSSTGGGGSAVSVSDGSNVVEGTTTDANTVNTIMGRLTKIRDELAAQLNSAISDGVTSSIKATVAQFHNSDNQAIGTGNGLLTGGVAQLINPGGLLDRQRATGFDGIAGVGIATGTQQLAGPALTTTFNGTVTGNASSQTITVASTASMLVGDQLKTSDNVEYAEVLTVPSGTTFTAILKNNHANAQTLTWYHYNQAKDATIGDSVGLIGISPSATYLYNNIASTLEFDRSANGEKDGATGQGTAVAAEYEFNGGGPILAAGTLSGYAFDRARNLQGKALSTATITSTLIGDTALAFASAAATKTVQPGSPILLAAGAVNVAANQKEIVYVTGGWVPGSGASVPLQSPVVNASSTTAAWEAYAFQGPGLNGFTAVGIGIEEEALFDPVSQEYFVERSATQDGVVPQNVVMESPALWNGSTMDRARTVAIGDGAAATGIAAEGLMLYNGTTYDRLKGTGGSANVLENNSAAIQTNTAASKTDLDTIVTNTNKIPASPATEGGNLATLVTQTLTPNVSDRWARLVGQVDLARVNGATFSNTNPLFLDLVRVLGAALSNTNPIPTQFVSQPNYVALTTPQAATTAATDTLYTFSSQVDTVIIQNNTGANLNYAFDAVATAGSLLLATGQTLIYSKKVTVVHFLTTLAQNVNGTAASNIVLLGEL